MDTQTLQKSPQISVMTSPDENVCYSTKSKSPAAKTLNEAFGCSNSNKNEANNEVSVQFPSENPTTTTEKSNTQDTKTILEQSPRSDERNILDGSHNNAESSEIDDCTKKHVSFNPNLPETEGNEILERLRGDAIGGTLYSERFVISTLLKLREMEESLDNDEKFEHALESLWDMTIEKDVVLKLTELDVYEIFTQSIIKYEKDSRLIEILVGIIGNMCAVSEEALELLCKSEVTIQALLELIGCGDSCVLIQLMRLLTIVYGSQEAARIWNRKIVADTEFIENLCFILNNSNNQILLNHSLETLNSILAKSALMSETCNGDAKEPDTDVLQTIATNDLVVSTIEAFQTFCAKENIELTHNETDEFMDTESTSETLKKTFTIFINIHDIFLNYRPQAFNNDTEGGLRKCLNRILHTVSIKNFVVPANTGYLQDLFEGLLSIFMISSELQNEETVALTINLWLIIKSNVNQSSNGFESPVNDFEADDLEAKESFKELCDLTEKFLTVLLKYYNGSSLKTVLRKCKAENALKILEMYGLNIENYEHDNLESYCRQLETVLKDNCL